MTNIDLMYSKKKWLTKLFSAVLFVTVGIFVMGGRVQATDFNICPSAAVVSTGTPSTATLNWAEASLD